MYNLLIADDHSVVRRGLKGILADTPDLMVGDEAANATEVLETIRARSWDALVLDSHLPDRMGLDVLKQAKKSCPSLPVLVLGENSKGLSAAAVLRAGASGFLWKDTDPEE